MGVRVGRLQRCRQEEEEPKEDLGGIMCGCVCIGGLLAWLCLMSITMEQDSGLGSRVLALCLMCIRLVKLN